jgi:peptide/nickel transport system permease protein
MSSYLLKRILWSIPALWFISTVVFVLIKLIPGQAAFLLEEDTQANTASRSAIYRQYLERTGQNLPLFYFSIRSFSEPDSLHTVYPYQEQQFLRRITLAYGKGPLVARFCMQLQQLKQAANQVPDTRLRAEVRRQLSRLFSAGDAATIQQILWQVAQTNHNQTNSIPVARVSQAALQSFTLLQQNKISYQTYIPAISWHGSRNQYHQWLLHVLKGDLGISLRDARPVGHILTEAIGNTLLLSVCSLLLIFVIAILLNFLMVHEDYQWLRKPFLHTLYIVDTIPLFLLALLLIMLLASSQYLLLFPVYGLGNLPEEATWLEQLSVRLYHLAIPMTCLTLSTIPYISSQLHTAMKEVKQAEYVQTARAKGVPEWKIVKNHIFKNSLLPLITLFSGFIPALLGGTVVIEVIFAIPGMGRLLADAVLARDYPVILGIVLVMALAKMLAHLIADVLYYLADPRIRFS